jgi:hypothetical protein
VNQPHIVRAMLQLKLGAHPRAVFAAFFLTKNYHLLDYVEIFNGTTDKVVVHMTEVLRAALQRNAEAVIAARSDPTVGRRLRRWRSGGSYRSGDAGVYGGEQKSLAILAKSYFDARKY